MWIQNISNISMYENLCCCIIAQSHLTLCNPKDYSQPGSSVHGIFRASILELVASGVPSPVKIFKKRINWFYLAIKYSISVSRKLWTDTKNSNSYFIAHWFIYHTFIFHIIHLQEALVWFLGQKDLLEKG